MKSVDPLHGVAAFLAVADHQGFSAAAEALGMTRATVSAQVSDLEHRLGVRLFHRSTRLVRLTPAGQAYREHLGDLPQRIYSAARAAQAEHAAPEGRLRLTAPGDFAERYLISWVAEFLASHPGMSIELDLSNTAHNLIDRGLDLAIRGTLAVEPNLITRKLGSSPLYFCASASYLARRGLPQEPEDLTAHDLIHFSALRRGRVWSVSRGEDRREVQVRPRLELSEGWAMRDAALRGAGICMLPSFLITASLRTGDLVRILPEWSVGSIPLHAVYPDNRLIAERVKTFVGFLARKTKAEPDLTPP